MTAVHCGALGGAHVAVVVLGDIGRSPRMQYHALALAEAGANVLLLGYRGRPVDSAVAQHPRIRVRHLPEPRRARAPAALFVPVALGDIAVQAAWLVRTLSSASLPLDLLLVQNPPAFPTLVVAALVARARKCRVVVDWHNFGADQLALRMGRGSRVVAVARAAERTFGRAGAAHLCVSQQMAHVLDADWGVPAAHVLRDRPAKRPGRPSSDARQALFDRIGLDVRADAGLRPALIVTSSSWTADEDFAVLLEAMQACDRARSRLLFVMTGDGPLRATWERRVAALKLSRVETRTLWLEADDYPRLLAAADLGVCLHRSSSGVDLPMKIADMFGAGLPVCALDYGPVLREMLRDGVNGRLFTTGAELGSLIGTLLDGFPHHTPALDALRGGVERTTNESWADGWRREALPVFQSLLA